MAANPFLAELFGTFDGVEENVTEEQMKVAEANLEEADLLGRAMAHAYVSELAELEKEAKVNWEAARAIPGKAWGGVKRGYGATKNFFKNSPNRYRSAGRSAREAFTGKGSIGDGVMTKKDRLRAFGYAAKNVAPEAGAAALAAGGAAYGLSRRGKKKQSSAEEFDYMAEKLAMGILHEQNINPYTLEPYESYQEKVAVEQFAAEQEYEEKTAGASMEDELYARAAEMLEAVGFEV